MFSLWVWFGWLLGIAGCWGTSAEVLGCKWQWRHIDVLGHMMHEIIIIQWNNAIHCSTNVQYFSDLMYCYYTHWSMDWEVYSMKEVLQCTMFTKKSGPSTIKLPNHQNHQTAPIFLHNPKAYIHVTSNVAPWGCVPWNEWNISRYIWSLKRFWTIWLCLYTASTP